MKYATKAVFGSETRLVDVVEVPSPLPAWAQDDAAWLAKQFPDLSGWVSVPDDAKNGAVDNGDGTYTSPAAPVRIIPTPSVTFARFEHIFATAIGEVEYDDIIDALDTIAATSPKTADTVKIKRALKAMRSAEKIDYPISDYKSAPASTDLTALFLAATSAALIGSDPDINTKIDAGLAAWVAAG